MLNCRIKILKKLQEPNNKIIHYFFKKINLKEKGRNIDEKNNCFWNDIVYDL